MDDAAELAERAVDLLEATADGGHRQRAAQVLTAITCFVPAPLRDVHRRLLADGVFVAPAMPVWAQLDGVVFRDADTTTRDRLIDIAEATLPGDWNEPATWRHRIAMSALAWIGDGTVQAAFDGSRLGGDPQAAARYAGWDLTDDGTRRDLCGPVCRPLVEVPGSADDAPPVGVLYPFDSTCPSCGKGLTVVLNLDLAHPELWFVGLPGERLRVVTCEGCVTQGLTGSEVDFEGNVRSFEPTGRPADWEPQPRLPRPVAFGEPDPTPFAAVFRERDSPGSHVGGHPAWVHGPDYPRHADCGALLRFLGQVDLGMGGVIYAFLDQPCGLVACQYQQI